MLVEYSDGCSFCKFAKKLWSIKQRLIDLVT